MQVGGEGENGIQYRCKKAFPEVGQDSSQRATEARGISDSEATGPGTESTVGQLLGRPWLPSVPLKNLPSGDSQQNNSLVGLPGGPVVEVHLPVREHQVQSLVQEDTHTGQLSLVSHNS